jgi:competence protein ComEA
MNNTLKTLGLALLLALPLAAANATATKAAPAAKAKAPGHPINLNTASVTELMQLPRVGPSLAQRIVAFRKEHGGFQRPEELMNVKGVGEKSYLKLKPYLSAGGSVPQAAHNPQPKAPKGQAR